MLGAASRIIFNETRQPNMAKSQTIMPLGAIGRMRPIKSVDKIPYLTPKDKELRMEWS